jgi:ABC-type bacteriocin/lantibiotic exporter with double-glycine peptidase domain
MKSPYQRFWLLLKPDNKEIYQVYTFAVFKGIIALSLPLGIQSIINLIQAGRVSVSWVLLVSIVALGIGIGGYLQVMQIRIMENIQQNIFTRAAFDFTYRIPKIKFEEINKHFAPELVNRFFDIITLQKSVAKIMIDFSSGILQIVFGLVLLSFYHSFFIVFSILLIVSVYSIIKFTSKKGLETSLEESKYKYKVVSWLEELARSKDSFKLAGLTHLPESKTDQFVSGYLKSRENHFKVLKTQYILLLVFKILITLVLLVIGGLLVLRQQMNIGQFVAAEIIILLIIDSSEKLILNLENVFDTLTSLEKVGQVLDLQLDEYNHSNSINSEIKQALDIEISGVSFTYPGRTDWVLKDVNYAFKSNQNYCITGSNGSGRSTLIHLISGLYHPQKGNICINQLPVGNYNIADLYKIIGNGLQEETIFEGTIFENITLGRSFIQTDDVLWAIEKTCLSDYIKSLPKGLDTSVDISGNKLSKSVFQKILLARSIVNKPKLLLLENQLDFIVEEDRKKIIDFLTDNNNGWTFICISYDQYMMEKCETVIFLEEGKIK